MKNKINKKQPIKVSLIVSSIPKNAKIDKNRMIDLLDDCDPTIRHLAYINLMIA